MLDLYGVSAQQGASLVQLARDSRQKGWWHAYSDTIQPQFATYIGLESAASEIRIYEVTLIPGLLQTEEYARTVIAAGTVGGDHEGTERNVALLMARQPLLTGDDPPRLWAVLDEAALRRTVGGAGLMRLQLDHLLDLARLPNVAIQVIPFGAGAHPAMGRPFVILAFPERADPDVVYLEDLTSACTWRTSMRWTATTCFSTTCGPRPCPSRTPRRASCRSSRSNRAALTLGPRSAHRLGPRGQRKGSGSGSACSTVSRDTARVRAT